MANVLTSLYHAHIYDPWCTHATPEMVAAYNSVVDIMCSMGAVKKQVTVLGVVIPCHISTFRLTHSLGELLEYSRVAHSIVITSEMLTAVAPYYEGKERCDISQLLYWHRI